MKTKSTRCYIALVTFLYFVVPTVWAEFPDLALETVSEDSLVAPVEIVNAGDGSGRLFVGDQRGQIQIIETDTDTLLATPFLDLVSKLVPQRANFDERGLLGIVFHPDYATASAPGEGKLYVYYSAPSLNAPGTAEDPVDHQSVIAEYTVSANPNLADFASERILLTFDQPQFNHNGGDLAFGPDGLLYISTGDGGSSNDNNAGHTGGDISRPDGGLGNAQDLTKLLGKILRIDPLGSNGPGGEFGIPAGNPFVGDGGGVREEIYAYGLRNPWRMSFDVGPNGTDRLFVGDVGQGRVEEINVVNAGENYGWRNLEGTFDFDTTAPGVGPFTAPIAQYAHPGTTIGSPALPQIGLSVTGGEVYRGAKIPALHGKYVFADWSKSFNTPDGTLLGLEETAPGVFSLSQLTVAGGNPIPAYISAVGSDENGDLYIATRTVLAPETDGSSNATGVISRIVADQDSITISVEPEKDNTMFEENGHSNGAGVSLFAGVTGSAAQFGHRRALMKFAMPSLPTGAQVQSAEVSLRLTKGAGLNGPFQLHRMTADWGEGTSNSGSPGGVGASPTVGDATWTHSFHNTTRWSTLGGDFNPSVSASSTISTVTTWNSATLAQDVQGWIDGDPNFGWILLDPGSSQSAKRFASREDSTPANRPKLEISYFVSASPVPTQLELTDASDSGLSVSDNITKVVTPTIEGIAPIGSTVTIFANGSNVGSVVVSSIPFSVTTSTLSAGQNTITATTTDGGSTSDPSAPLIIIIDIVGPTVGTPDLLSTSDSGTSDADDLTKITTPVLEGTAEANASVQLTSSIDGPVGSALATSGGQWSITSLEMNEGIHTLSATATDAAGNSATSGTLTVDVDLTPPAAPTGLDLLPESDDGPSDTDNDTSLAFLEISGTAAVGTTVVVSSDLQGVIANLTGASSFRFSTPRLQNGLHQITATSGDAAGNTSADSVALAINVTAVDGRDGKPVDLPGDEATDPSANSIVWDDVAAGLFDGLLLDQTDGETLIGAISNLKVNKAKTGSGLGGSVSGVINFGGRKASMKGTFDANGVLTLDLTQRDGTVVDIDLQLVRTAAIGAEAIQGTITWDGISTNAELARAPYHSRTNPLDETIVGRYTAIFPSAPGTGLTEPGGDGISTATISKGGLVRFSAILGDGVRFTESAPLSVANQFSLYRDLYGRSPIGGLIGGKITLRDVLDVSDFDGKLHWRKVAREKEKRYFDGFEVELTAIGSKYIKPERGFRILAQLADQNHNAELSFIGPTAPNATAEALDRVLTWKSNNRLIHYGPERLRATAGTTTGNISGSFYDPATRLRVPFRAISFQKQGIAAGNFVSGDSSGAIRVLPGTTFDFPGSEPAGALTRAVLPGDTATPPNVTDLTAFDSTSAGIYFGVLEQGGAISGGLQSVKMTSSGAVSGSVYVSGQRFAFRGRLDAETGGTVISINRKGLDPLELTLQLGLADGTTDGFHLTGNIDIDSVLHDIDTQRRPVFTRAEPSPHAGRYTLAILAPDGTDPALDPAGDGYAILWVSINGTAKASLSLADGTKTTLSGHFSRNNEWSIHRKLYTRVVGGYIAGKLTVRPSANLSDIDGELRWLKPNGAGPTKVYPAGFDLVRVVIGSACIKPEKNIRAFDVLEDKFYNAWLRLVGNGVDFPDIERAVTWNTANRIIYYGPERLRLTFNKTNGRVTGSYLDTPNLLKAKIGGVFLEDLGVVTGFYLSNGLSEKAVIDPRTTTLP